MNPAAFDLPPRSVFEPPSYPNVWFYVAERLAPSQGDAVELITGWLRDHCGLANDFGRFKPPEASDSQARLAGLQPWRDAADPALHHAHDLHIRYYYVALRQRGQDRVILERPELVASAPQTPTASNGRETQSPNVYHRFAGAVHYEVEDEHALHPYIDECPYCGRTGEYAGTSDLFADVHEPLGLELLLYGTIRGRRLTRRDGRPVPGLIGLQRDYVITIHTMRPGRPDMNVVELSVVVVDPGQGRAVRGGAG